MLWIKIAVVVLIAIPALVFLVFYLMAAWRARQFLIHPSLLRRYPDWRDEVRARREASSPPE